MQEDAEAHPSTINVTYSTQTKRITKNARRKRKRRVKRKKKIQKRKSVNQYMFGTSLRCGKAQMKQEGALIYRVNKTASERRVEMMPILFQNAPITEEYAGCSQAWGNCS
jgi:hypothetical protein